MPDWVVYLWPVVASMALVCGARLRSAQRRTALNRAMHELRRPLQALILAPGGQRSHERSPGPLELALVALDDLDVAINGTRPVLTRRPVAARPLVEGTVSRWRALGARRDRSVRLEWDAGAAVVMADPARLTQALDNLLANAIEHGRGPVMVRGTRSPVGLSLEVVTAGTRPARRHSDPRRGHGLAVVERVAVAHLGRFRIRSTGQSVAAVLELPLASSPLPAIPIEWASGKPERSLPTGLREAAEPPAPSAA